MKADDSRPRVCADEAGSLPCVAAPARPDCSRVQFTDVTAAAGIQFTHNTGRAGKKWLPETMGSGCAFFDADGDGWPDILLVNSKDWTPRGRRSTAALYRNNSNGTFTDVTARQRPGCRDVRPGRRRRRLRQRRPRRRLHHRARRRPAVSQRRRRQVPRVTKRPASPTQLQLERRLARLRQRRQARSVRRQLRAVDRAGRSVVLARRRDQVVLHARNRTRACRRSSIATSAAASSKT